MKIDTDDVSTETVAAARRRIAVVTPWFGADLRGGAEQQAWQVATRLAQRGHAVEVLTTCCRSFFDDWGVNHLPAGVVTTNGLTVRRFPVSPRDREAFDRLNAELLGIARDRLRPGVSPVSLERASLWSRENINSKALQEHLAEHREEYDDVIFIPYLYGTTVNCLKSVADKAWLQPCLHDEAYAYLPDIAETFYKPKGLLFISDGEAELAARLYGPSTLAKGIVVGAGVEFDRLENDSYASVPESVRDRSYVLCLGRRDPGKGVARLVDAFRAFRERDPATTLTLVLAGPGESDYGDPTAGIVDFGPVSESTKVSLLRGCRALCQPSTNESFSRVLFEAWYCGRPVLVHRECLATSAATEASGGGWLAGPLSEWSAMLGLIDESSASSLSELGARGHAFARSVADWDAVITRYEEVFNRAGVQRKHRRHSRKQAIHQLLPNLSFGDAISNEALFIRDELRALGFDSRIFARYIDPMVRTECIPFTAMALEGGYALVYHHSIGSEVTSFAAMYRGPKCLLYHNITPPEFFATFRPEFANLLRRGREQMWSLAPAFPVSAGDSAYNAAELEIFGFDAPGVLPLAVNPAAWAQRPDDALVSRLQDGVQNLLFVGRVAPNKCQHQLIEAFCRYRELENARLILVGSHGRQDPYASYVRSRIEELGLDEHVLLVGHCSTEELHAYYRSAHLFWSMSEHEGFCVPLVEAMWFDVPVLAFRSTAIPETLGKAGSTFSSKRDLAHVARLAHELATESSRRRDVLISQRARRLTWTPDTVKPSLHRIIDRLTGQCEEWADVLGVSTVASDPALLRAS